MKNITNPKVLIELRRLELSSPEEVFRYFETLNDFDLSYELSEALANTDKELVKLALAKYSNNDDVLCKLYFESDDIALRCAALSNEKIIHFLNFKVVDEIGRRLIETGTQSEIHAFVTNRSLKNENLQSIFEKRGWAESLSDEQWYLFSILALYNPNLAKDYESVIGRGLSEGYESYQHGKALSAAWNLLLSSPLTEEWAGGLAIGISNLVPYTLDESFYMKVLDRWHSVDKIAEERFSELRKAIASEVPHSMQNLHEWMSKSNDKSIRIGHYYSFKGDKTSVLDEYYVRDGKEFIDAALSNENLFKDKKIRKHLKHIIDKYCEERSDYFELDSFDSALERTAKKHPNILNEDEDWFRVE